MEDNKEPMNWSDLTKPEGAETIVVETPEVTNAPPAGQEHPPVVTLEKKVEGQPTAYTPKYKPLWESLGKRIEGYTPPEKLTKGEFAEGETEEDVFISELLSNAEPDLGFEPDEWDIEYLEKRKDPEFNRTDYLDQYIQKNNVLKQSDDELLFNAYKNKYGKTDANPEGIDDDGINDHISKLTLIQKKETAEGIRNGIRTQQSAQVTQQGQKRIEKLQGIAAKTLESTKDITEFYGIKPDNAQVSAFRTEFPKYFVPDDKGVTPFDKIVNNDAEVYRMLFLRHQDGEALKSIGMSAGQETKEQLEQRLGLTNKIPGGGGGSIEDSPTEWNKMATPEK